MQLDGLARGLGISVRQVPLSPEAGWQPDLDAVRAAIGPRTRLIIACDPNNPTGTILTAASRQGLAEIAEERGVWLLVDEIYRGAEIDGGDAATAWGLGPRVLVSGGLSKSFACPGLRLGWLIAPPEVVAECHRRQDYTTIGTGTLAQLIGERVMQPENRDRLLRRGRSILAEGREMVRNWLTAAQWLELGGAAGGRDGVSRLRFCHAVRGVRRAPARRGERLRLRRLLVRPGGAHQDRHRRDAGPSCAKGCGGSIGSSHGISPRFGRAGWMSTPELAVELQLGRARSRRPPRSRSSVPAGCRRREGRAVRAVRRRQIERAALHSRPRNSVGRRRPRLRRGHHERRGEGAAGSPAAGRRRSSSTSTSSP